MDLGQWAPPRATNQAGMSMGTPTPPSRFVMSGKITHFYCCLNQILFNINMEIDL
jgi:hypothetical protein